MTNPRIPTVLLVCSLAALALGGCAGGSHADLGPEAEPEGVRSAADAVTPAEASDVTRVTGSPSSTTAASAPPVVAVKNWRPWMEAEVERLRSTDPEYFNAVMDLPPRTTRAQLERLTGPLVRNPDAAPILLYRLLSRGEPAATRAAIVEALPRTQGDFSAAVADLMALETDPQVRELVCSALYRAQAPYALQGLTLGVADSSARVRAEALRSLGRRSDGAELAPRIIAALTDVDPVVQQEAARALGNLKVESAAPALRAQLGSGSAEVRLHALRALSRVDPEGTRALPQLTSLRGDPDPKVARLAERLATAQ